MKNLLRLICFKVLVFFVTLFKLKDRYLLDHKGNILTDHKYCPLKASKKK